MVEVYWEVTECRVDTGLCPGARGCGSRWDGLLRRQRELSHIWDG